MSGLETYFPTLHSWFTRQVDDLPWRLHIRFVSVLSAVLFLMYAPHWSRFFAAGGPLVLVHSQQTVTSWFGSYAFWWWWVAFLSAIGLSYRKTKAWACLGLGLVAYGMISTNWAILSGEDRLLRYYLPLLLCVPLRGDGTMPGWQLCLLRWQIAVVYFWAGLTKFLTDVSWIDGSAVFYAWNFDLFSRLPFEWTQKIQFLSPPMTWTTLWFETTFPVVFLHPALRRWYVITIFGFHVGVILTMKNIEMFNLMTIAGLVLFVEREDIALLARLKGLRRWRFGGHGVLDQRSL